MIICRNLNNFSKIKDSIIITIGNFDGIHLGHQKLIKNMMEIKKTTRHKTAIISFQNHTKNSKTKRYKLLYFREKYNKLNSLNIDYLILLKFTNEIRNQSYNDFLDLLIRHINIKYFIASDKLKIGHKMSGDTKKIKKYFENKKINTKIIKSTEIENNIISSSLIRNLIVKKDFSMASKFLGYEYFLSGRIIKGKKLGASIGYPTANVLPYKDYLLPPPGVYGTEVIIKKKKYFGVTFVGNSDYYFQKNRKIYKKKNLIIVETHLLNFSKSVYNYYMRIYFKFFIRETIKISSVKELKNIIKKDIQKYKEIINE